MSIIYRMFKFQGKEIEGQEKCITLCMLVTNSETSYFIAFELTLDKQTFKISSNSRTVNCSGCDSGCSPKQDEEGNWMCSPGCGFNPITSNPRCNKSETIVVKQFVQLAIVAA